MSISSLPVMRLKPQEDRRLRAGHLWIYSNEIDVSRTPLTGVVPGSVCVVENAQGRPLGVGHVNPHSLISIRLLSRNPQERLNQAWLERRLRQALSWRDSMFSSPCYRWVYGESDGLPGVVIDRYHDDIVIQLNTAGMDQWCSMIVEAVMATVSPRSIVLRNDSSMRQLEGLPTAVTVAMGDAPEQLNITENGAAFSAPALEGQKTGWFYDHRENRDWVAWRCRGKRVLDLFSYLGGWGVLAAARGAESVTCVDVSATALDGVRRNAVANAVTDRIETMQGDALDVVASLAADGARYDVVICDPPAFIKRKKDFNAGLTAYRHVNEHALRLLTSGGLLVSASCSMHLPGTTLQDTVRAAARHVDRHVQRVYLGGQGPDHPVHPCIPETDYLKCMVFQTMPAL